MYIVVVRMYDVRYPCLYLVHVAATTGLYYVQVPGTHVLCTLYDVHMYMVVLHSTSTSTGYT